jgi:hypothetical protein
MPDADRYWRDLETPEHVEALVDGLLICHVSVATASRPDDFPRGGWNVPRERDWDAFNGPDLRLRFQFRDEVVGLFGPDDHWEMFVSIPAVTLRRGDRVQVGVWDRDVMSDQSIGRASAVFAGEFPWRFDARHLRFDCRGADNARARAWAAPWAAQIDAALDRIAAARPDPAASDFGEPVEIEELRNNWRGASRASFRYYAGFLGWRDADVQRRLTRYRDEVHRWNERIREVAPAAARP